MEKLNIVLDYSNLVMRSITIPGTVGYSSSFETDEDLADIARHVVMDVCYTAKLFNSKKPNRVIIATDSKNAWRKDILVEGAAIYKANRSKDDKKNWGNLWNTMDEVLGLLKKNGFEGISVDHAEADDIAALLKERLFDVEGESVVLVSTDKDWKQLADHNMETNAFVAVYNPVATSKGRRRMFVTEDTYNFLTAPKVRKEQTTRESIRSAIFSNTSGFASNVDNYDIMENVLLGDSKIGYEIINPHRVAIDKIFTGDDGDNVPSYFDYYKTTKRGTISTGVTPSQVEKLCVELSIDTTADLEGKEHLIKESLERIMKRELPVDAVERLDRQRRFVELKSDFFPEDVVRGFNREYVEMSKTVSNSMFALNWHAIIKGTKFDDELIVNQNARLNSVFKGLESGINEIFFKK